MRYTTKKDLLYAAITGLTTGVLVWRIFAFLDKTALAGISLAWLVILVPVFWVLGVNLGFFLGQWIKAFNQFGKFVAIGFTNAAVDFGILYLFIAITGRSSGIYFSVFKTVSFSIAVIHSYLWNKYWAFNAGKSGGGHGEFLSFLSVSIFSILVNVGIASLVVNVLGPQFDMTNEAWAGIGAIVGSASALIFSFLGFKKFVFKK
jgi:putative flippase GtrA